jgi:hypothetical protein
MGFAELAVVTSLGACRPPSTEPPTDAAPVVAPLDARTVDDAMAVDGSVLTATRYPAHRLHSPMSQNVIERMTQVLRRSSGRPGVFAKVGDSITAHGHFLTCLAGNDIELGSHVELEATRRFFLATRADESHSSFDRTSLSAGSGWSTRVPLMGTPSPIERETAAIRPAFAVVMFGTNDVYREGIAAFERNLRSLVDRLLDLGVVPLVSTIPPRNWNREASELISEMNAVVRVVAQSRQVPWMDYHATLVALPRHGLAKDGIHPQTWKSGGLARPCWMTEAALQEGINARNLIVLQSLDRARRFLIEGEQAELVPSDLQGEGKSDSPFEIGTLPFVDARDACVAGDVVYRLPLGARARIRIRVFSDAGVRATARFYPGEQASDSASKGDTVLETEAGPGTMRVLVRAIGQGTARGGYRVTMVEVAR